MRNEKILYIAPGLDLENTRYLGVKRKILGQLKGFEKNGFRSVYVDISDQLDNVSLMESVEGEGFVRRKFRSIVRRLLPFYGNDCLNKVQKAIGDDSVVVYFRKPLLNYYTTCLLYKVSRISNVKTVFLEIPTWPYDKELIAYPQVLRREKIYRRVLKFFVDKIVTFSDERKLLGIETVIIDNGISVDDIKCIQHLKPENNEITFLGVAHLSQWTGYDRFIHGLSDFCRTKKGRAARFLIAGDGNEIENLKRFVQELGLEDKVNFCGNLEGDALDALFEMADVCVGNLAWHRVGVSVNPDLKNREYCARGIPFVTSTTDPGFPENFSMLLKVCDDETPVDLENVIKFYEELQHGHPGYAKTMYDFAAENFDWARVLMPLVNDIVSS